jgi:hypothetical protein
LRDAAPPLQSHPMVLATLFVNWAGGEETCQKTTRSAIIALGQGASPAASL